MHPKNLKKLTPQQRELIKKYREAVKGVFHSLEALQKLMKSKEFQKLHKVKWDDRDDEMQDEMGTVYGDFSCFLNDLPNAV